MEKRKVAVLGSTNTSGKQALQVIMQSDVLSAEVLTATSDYDLLVEQALAVSPECVVVEDEQAYKAVEEKLWEADIKVYAGQHAVSQVAASGNVDFVLNALPGLTGLIPTLEALKADKMVAPVSGIQVVAGGKFLMDALKSGKGMLLPSTLRLTSLFRTLQRTSPEHVKSILITTDDQDPMNVLLELACARFYFGNSKYVVKECSGGSCLGAVMLKDGSIFYSSAPQEGACALAYVLHYPGLTNTEAEEHDAAFEGIRLNNVNEQLLNACAMAQQVLSKDQPVQGWVLCAAYEAAVEWTHAGKLTTSQALSLIEKTIANNKDACSNPEVLIEHYNELKSRILSSESVTTPTMK